MNSGESGGGKPAKIDSPSEKRVRNTAMRMFVMAVLDMSWQLALVVLLPIIGGYELDKHWHITPWLTISGFVIAMFGTYLVIKKMLEEYGNKSVGAKEENK